MFLRSRMFFLLKRIDRAFTADESGDDDAYPRLMQYLYSRPSLKPVIYALAEVDAVRIDEGDNGHYDLSRGNRSRLYFLERSELWVNRILAFIAGIGATLFTELIIRNVF